MGGVFRKLLAGNRLVLGRDFKEMTTNVYSEPVVFLKKCFSFTQIISLRLCNDP